MPIITPNVSSPAGQQYHGTTPNDAALAAFLQGLKGQQAASQQGVEGEQKLAQIGASGDQSRQSQAAKLQGDLEAFPKLKEMSPDMASIKVGDVASGSDPSAMMHQKLASNISKDYGVVDKGASKIDDKYDSLTGRLENVKQGLDRDDALGMKQAMVGMAGASEGKGQRLMKDVISAFGGKPTAAGTIEDADNFISGLQNSGKSDAFKQSMYKAAQSLASEAQKNHSAEMDAFKSRAPQLAGTASSYDPSFKDKIGGYGSNIQSRLGALSSGLTPPSPAPATPVQQAANPILGGLARMFGGSAPKSPSSTPASPGGSLSFEEWKKAKAEGKL